MIDTLWHYWEVANSAIDNTVMTVAIVLTAAILAAVGGFVSARMRLYGAIVGGMMLNAVVKAMGGGFAPALAAMVVATALGFALGSTPFLLRLMKNAKRSRD